MEHTRLDPGNRYSVDEPRLAPRLIFVLLLVFRGRLGDDHLSRERRTWNTVLFGSPRSQIRELASLRAEWTPGVGFPSCELAALGAHHGYSVMPEPNGVQLLKRPFIAAQPSTLLNPSRSRLYYPISALDDSLDSSFLVTHMELDDCHV